MTSNCFKYRNSLSLPTVIYILLYISCSHCSVILWQRCHTLCTSSFMDVVTFGRNGPYGDAWKAEPL